jgi:hydroxyacyl-ACP dehydratase HTD2-like protein with hotdog domain
MSQPEPGQSGPASSEPGGQGLRELLTGWAPEPAETTETITAGPAVALAGLLDTEPPVTGPGDEVPPLWHWLYFLDRPAQHELGPDGHPAQGRFMPPLPGRRRMYAGGRVSYLSPVRCGDPVTRRSELAGWRVRHGRSGEMLFVTVRHTFRRGGSLVATEEQDLVYRSGPAPALGSPAAGPGHSTAAAAAPSATRGAGPPAPAPVPAAPWQLQVTAGAVLLFRFSALTYNAHRIHYDAEYATAVEGHPGLVVHGPLLALLCLELPRRHQPGQRISGLSFRARSPVYAGQLMTITGGPQDGGCTMGAAGPDGTVAMTAEGHSAPGDHRAR